MVGVICDRLIIAYPHEEKDMPLSWWLCIPINNQLDAQFRIYIYIYIFIYLFISILYMFRTTLCSSSGESIVSIHHLLYRVSQKECARLREDVPYVKLYRYNPKHLYPKLNGYGDNGQRKVWTSCISASYTPTAVSRSTHPGSHMTACRAYVG